MPMIKDSQYWQVYNQKRKEYLAQKKRESRAKLKGLVVDSSGVVDKQASEQVVVMTTTKQKVVDISSSVVDISEKVVDQIASVSTTKTKLWADYYRTKKPYCWRCIDSGIKETEYAYCSEEKEYNPTFQTYFDQCLIKHWEKHNQMERVKHASH